MYLLTRAFWLLAVVGSTSLALSLEPRACLPAVEYAADLSYVGCYTDTSSGSRTLANNTLVISGNSVKVCSDICGRLGYQYAGVEFGR
jgi:hypothetical protein